VDSATSSLSIFQISLLFSFKKVLVIMNMSVLTEPELIFGLFLQECCFEVIPTVTRFFSLCLFVLSYSELEESLIVLPFSVATDMLTLLNHWLQVNKL